MPQIEKIRSDAASPTVQVTSLQQVLKGILILKQVTGHHSPGDQPQEIQLPQ
jgi:hypothetical protein